VARLLTCRIHQHRRRPSRPEELEKSGQPGRTSLTAVVSPPVRFIKTIGDAVVMWSERTRLRGLRKALELLAVAGSTTTFPSLRIGIA